jgi:hypothetical protein
MTPGIEQAITDLQAHLRYHERAAEQLRQALAQLRDLPRAEDGQPKAPARTRSHPPAKKRHAKPKPTPIRKAGTRPGGARVTLAEAMRHVLAQHREAGRSGVKPKVLYEQVQQAGYRFGGKPDNHLHQLYKALRRHAEFKRASDGTYALS